MTKELELLTKDSVGNRIVSYEIGNYIQFPRLQRDIYRD